MKKVIIALVIVAIVLVGFATYRYFAEKRQSGPLVLYGNVDVRQVNIGFRVPGQVEDLLFEEGDVVKSGDLMARLDCTPYTSQVEQACAQVSLARANFINAEKLLKRRQELIDIEGVSQEDLDDATTSLAVQEATLNAAKAALAVAEDNLAYTEAYAPTEGIVLTRIREPGSVVNASEAVMTVSITSPIWVRAYVSEPDLGRVRFGMEAEIHTDTKDAPVYKGRVGFISPVAEFTPKTVQTTQLRTDLVYRLRIYVDNPDCILKQGMPVTVKLLRDEQ